MFSSIEMKKKWNTETSLKIAQILVLPVLRQTDRERDEQRERQRNKLRPSQGRMSPNNNGSNSDFINYSDTSSVCIGYPRYGM